MVKMTQPEAMGAAAAHVAREYGQTGYMLGIEEAAFSRAVFLVRHSDGSEFRLMADRYGNVDRLPDDWRELTTEAALVAVREIDSAREARLARIIGSDRYGH